jgi:hypothetical protein
MGTVKTDEFHEDEVRIAEQWPFAASRFLALRIGTFRSTAIGRTFARLTLRRATPVIPLATFLARHRGWRPLTPRHRH